MSSPSEATSPPAAEDLPLDALLACGSMDAAAARALLERFSARQQDFARAIASGGAREDFARWQASQAALAAAIEILRPAAQLPDAP